MTKKLLLIIPAVALILVVGANVLAAPAAEKRPPWTPDQAVWKLTKLEVVDPGRTENLPADRETGFPGGTFVSGYILEGKAKASSGKLLPEGTIRLTLSAFSPNADMPGQDAGWWTLSGEWTLIDKKGNASAKKDRHSPYTITGKLNSELPFNPLADDATWTARAVLPMSTAAGRWARGAGVVSLLPDAEGALQLDLKLWSQTPQGGG